MRRLVIIAFAAMLSSIAANAQTIYGQSGPEQQIASVNKAVTVDAVWNSKHVDLLDFENKLLDRRKTALILSIAGAGVSSIGASLGIGESEVGATLTIVGGLATLTGGVWFLVNEFKLINCQKKINSHLTLRYTPTSIALTF